MITDVFYERYKANQSVVGLKPADLQTPLNQGLQIIQREGVEILRAIESSGAVQKGYRLEQLAESAHARICRELGWNQLNNEGNSLGRCKAAIAMVPGSPEFAKHGPQHLLALSVLEQLFYALERAVDRQIVRLDGYCQLKEVSKTAGGGATSRDGVTHDMRAQAEIDKANALIEATRSAMRSALDELNLRFSRAGIPLAYHSGLFQIASESPLRANIAEPFWRAFSSTKWASVVTDFQEAIDRRDNGERDATKYAFMGLESVVRILSDDLKRTKGGESGFASWISNLTREVNGARYMDQWESDTLILLNKAARNLHAHGPGSQPHPNKTPAQIDACIWTAMAWAQSLVSR